jgi:hypothetical protein
MSHDLKNCRVLVTPTTFGFYDEQLRKDLEEAVGAHTDGAANCMGREAVQDCLAVLCEFSAGLRKS